MDASTSRASGPPRRKISFKRLGGILIVLAIAALIITEATGATQALANWLNPPMHFIEVTYITHEAGAAAQLAAAGDGFFLATRDAMRFFNTDGAEVFRHGHTISNATLFSRGGYAAVLEQNGRVFNVYNAQGLMYSIVTDAPIVRFALGAQGFAAVMMHGGSGIFDIEIYDNFGTRSHYGRHTDENIVPMLMDISHDGRVLAIAYLDINGAQMNSFVSFFSIDGSHVGAGDIFAENRHNPGEIVGAMRFLADGRLVVVSDARIFVLDATAATAWETNLNNRVTHVEFSDFWFAVAYGDAKLNRVGHAPGTVVARNSFGIQLFTYSAPGGAVTGLQTRGGNIVVGSTGGHFAALSDTGQALWELTLPGNVQTVAMMGGPNNVVVLSPTQTSILRRIRDN